jgi:large repetitive protein
MRRPRHEVLYLGLLLVSSFASFAKAATQVTTTSLPSGTVGQPYSASLSASGGSAPYSWSVSAGSLPSGLSLAPNGTLSGSPNSSGTFNFTVKATSSGKNPDSDTQALSIVVAPALAISTGSLPAGQVGVPYSQTLQASGGTAPYTWSITTGALPSGLNLSGSQISGTPAASGISTFTVKVVDANLASITKTFGITVAPAPLSITTTSLSNGQIGVPYSQALQASGGSGTYTWSISAGALPAGLNLNASGHISGTPTAPGTANITVKVTDTASGSATRALSITIAAALTSGGCPSATGVAGGTYSATLSASGGTPPYVWTIASGQLPPGLALSASGQISGTPSTAGSFNFGIKVSDQMLASVTSNCTVIISAPAPTLTISTSSLPDGVVGSSYAQGVSATGGQPPYSWSVSGGSLPPGLSLNGAQISGAPTASGTFPFTLHVSDASGKTATKDLSIRIGAALTVVTSSLASLQTGVATTQQLTASGGVPPYSWAVVSGSLPPGLALSTSGLISGTPTLAGSFSFTIRVSDSGAASANRAFTLAVSVSLSINGCPAINATQGQSYASAAVASGGLTPYTWTLAAGPLPTGLVFNSSSGTLSGTPGDSGTYPYTLLLTDKAGATATRDCQLIVTSSLIIGTASLPDASQSSSYTQTLSATGGKPPYTWSIVSGNLPGGLTLSPAGLISGIAIPLGTFNFTAAVTDSNGASMQRALSIRVVSGINVSSCSATAGEVGLVFDSPVLASGGSPPYAWTISAGSLPPGLTLDPVSGDISGTPSQAGSVQFSVDVRDITNHGASRQCSIDVAAALSISTSSLSSASSSVSYSDTIGTTGGVPPYVWSTTAGALPPGLSLNSVSGHITGTPVIVGNFAFTAKVIDGMGGQATKSLSIAVTQGLTITDCPTPGGSVGVSYTALLAAVGGAVPYQWRIDSGALPPGLVLSSDNAAISGTPLQPGLSTYVLRVDDASAKSTTRLCSIQINPPGLNITSPSTLPSGLVATPYSQTLTATGGRTPYSWSITTAGVPSGIALDGTGVVSGLPGAVGTFTFTVQVTDQDNNVARQSVTLAILAGSPPNVTITGLPDIIDPAQQPTFGLQLDSGYPAPIDGTLTLVFTPDPAIGVDDPAVQFATGGRVMTFTVPANSTQAAWSAPVIAFQSGTVSGNIQLNVKLESGGTDITPPGASRTIRVDRLAPRIVKVQVVPTSSGFDVHLTGYATTREVTQGTFRFSGAASASPIVVTVPLSSTSATWFQSAQSDTFGGQFGLIQSFSWQGQPASGLNAVSVSLTNAQGASAELQAQF